MGSKSTWANNVGSREQKILGIVSKNLTILRIFLCLASLVLSSDTYFAFYHQYMTYFNLSPLHNILLIQRANEGNLRELGDGKNNLGSTQSKFGEQ